MNDRFMNTYARTGLVLERGAGARLYASDGTEYIDFTSGIGVNSLGHAHPRLVEAVARQAGKVMHVSNYFQTGPSIALSERLSAASGCDRVFFCNSGAEANETLIKIARKWGSSKKPGKNRIVTLKGSFHGRTVTTVTATGQDKYHTLFGPFTPGFAYVEPDDIEALKLALQDDVCAFLFEPILGEGGLLPLDPAYLTEARALCKSRDILFAADEVQTGAGRTGAFLACQKLGLEPDIVSLAKGLAGGVPVGAVAARGECADTLQPGDHGTTFGGNPLAASAALVVLDELESPGFYAGIGRKGAMIMDEARSWNHPLVTDVRGMGLMIGLGLEVSPGDVVAACRERGLLALTAGTSTLRLLPPLVIRDEDIVQGLAILRKALDAIADKAGQELAAK